MPSLIESIQNQNLVNRNGRGEDKAYALLKLANIDYIPIQLGCFRLNTYSGDEFGSIIKNMHNRVVQYVSSNWTNFDEHMFEEIQNEEDLDKIICAQIKVIQIKYVIKTKTIYVLLNHERVGGGDYLVLGSFMFNGRTNSLLKEPTSSYIDVLKTRFAKYYCQYIVLSKVFFKKPINCHKKVQIISSKVDIGTIQSLKIGTKFMLIHTIMTNIMNSATNTDRFVCWIPLGFEKTQISPNNNVGIIVFTFVRDMTPSDVQNAISANSIMSIGSRQMIIDNYDSAPKSSTYIETRLKRNIDVVLTLANILDNTVKIDAGYGGMYYKMDTNNRFPYYVWGMTMDNEAHICYNVAHTSCNIDRLLIVTNGSIITDENVFSLNKNCNITLADAKSTF